MTHQSGTGWVGMLILGSATAALLGMVIFGGPTDNEAGGTGAVQQRATTPMRPGAFAERIPAPPAMAAAAAANATSGPSQLTQQLLAQRMKRQNIVAVGRQLATAQEAVIAPQQPTDAPGSEVPVDKSVAAKDAPTGTLPKEEIQAAVRSIKPALKSCYEGGLKMKGDSEGVVKVSFTIVGADGGGFMRDAEILSSDLGNPVADACLLDAIAKARFPAPSGGGEVRVTYPFRFASGAQQQ